MYRPDLRVDQACLQEQMDQLAAEVNHNYPKPSPEPSKQVSALKQQGLASISQKCPHFGSKM